MMQMMQMKSVIRGVSRDKALRVTAFHALAICFALITFAPAAKAFQDPQDGGPRVETNRPAIPKTVVRKPIQRRTAIHKEVVARS